MSCTAPRLLSSLASRPWAPCTTALARTFTSTARRPAHKVPALADVPPDREHVFEQKQKEFRASLEQAKQKAERQSTQYPTKSQSSSGKSGEKTLGSFSINTDEARAADDPQLQSGKKPGAFSSLIYGTAEGRQMDKDIERSFSQVLARGKYVHSIVFHEVKPDKVDDYVELVGDWYPKVAASPENKVHLVGSWRTEVGDCDTFGRFNVVRELC